MYKSGEYILVDCPQNAVQVISANTGKNIAKYDLDLEGEYPVSFYSHNGYFYIGYSSGTLARVQSGKSQDIKKINNSFVVNKMLHFDDEHIILVGDYTQMALLNVQTFMTNKKLTLDFGDKGDIYDIQVLNEISNTKKTYIFMTSKGGYLATVTKNKKEKSSTFDI